MSYDHLLDRVARLEQRIATLNPVGPVAERDKDKGVRVRLGGTDDAPFLSPWIKPPAWAGVTNYTPDIGEQVMLHSHGGDWTQATLQPLTHSDAKPNPSTSIDETVIFNKGKIRITADHTAGTVTLTNDKAKTTWTGSVITHEVDNVTVTHDANGITRTVGGVTEKLTTAGLDTSGGKLSHNQRDVGADHVHSGVQQGGGKTQVPDP